VCVLYGVFVYESTSVGRCGSSVRWCVIDRTRGETWVLYGRGGVSPRARRASGGDGWIGIGSDSTTRARDSRRRGGDDEDDDDDANRATIVVVVVVSSSRARRVGRRSR